MGINYSLELVTDKKTKTPILSSTKTELLKNLHNKGFYTHSIGRLGNRLHIGPPCTTTKDEADKSLDIVLPIVAGLKPG